ncbi:hypothetical protein Ac2012v2_007151 [Leucoagaricus gongylophorus]
MNISQTCPLSHRIISMALPRTICVGILICDTLSGPVDVAQKHFDDIYYHYWRNTIPENCSAGVVIKTYNVKKLEFPEEDQLDKHDIFMVTGSTTAAYDDSIPWVRELLVFLRNLIHNHHQIKLCGICFGHQIICRALGSECTPSGQWEIGPTLIDLSDIGRSIFGVDKLSLQQVHSDHVPVESLSNQFASGELHLVGSTRSTRNQGVIKFYPVSDNEVKTPRDIHILTLQGHPEFSESMITRIIREHVDDMALSTLNDYWGPKGSNYDSEPEDKDETGRRWLKTDGIDIVSRALWRMLVEVPPRDDTEEGITMAPHRQIGTVSNAGSDKLSRLWILSSGTVFMTPHRWLIIIIVTCTSLTLPFDVLDAVISSVYESEEPQVPLSWRTSDSPRDLFIASYLHGG